MKSKLLISAINTCLRIKGGKRNDIDDIKQYYLRNKEVIDKAFTIASKKYGDNRLHAQRGTKSAAVFLSIAGAINSGVDMCVIAEWYKVFNTGYYDECSLVDTNTAKSVLLLRKYFDSMLCTSGNSNVAVEQIKKCMSSIHAFDNGQSIKNIKGAIYYKIPELEKLQ